MIGRITFDKSSKDLKLFLYSIYLIGKYGSNNRIRRNFAENCFVEKMSAFTGSNAYKIKNGEKIEERTLYNKSLYAQYYGFVERDKDENNKEWMELTARGRILFQYIECDEESKTCFVSPENKKVFQTLVWNSILYDSFGYMNDGAQTSKTDVDAPKVIFRTIFDLGSVTNDEYFYILFSLNRGDDGKLKITKTYDDLLEEVKKNREKDRYTYTNFFDTNGLNNKVDDSKVIDILSSPELGILTKKVVNGIEYNVLSEGCLEFKNDSKLFQCWYRPQTLIMYSPSEKSALNYVDYIFLNKRKERNSSVKIDVRNIEVQLNFNKLFISAIKDANGKENDIRRNFIIICNSENQLSDLLGDKISLLNRIKDYTSDDYGFSKENFILETGEKIKIPYNFNFIAIITK